MKTTEDIVDFCQQRIALIDEGIRKHGPTPSDAPARAALVSVLEFAGYPVLSE
ncbi:hypothetical protein GCM10023346_48670 [Arthrobacter gyeryongensis]|uniref:Uncharacterized protein n=1 Tax=Arthrobacter gyeryongensis TaxID=1650592 RepID=A0ABP8VCA4_9MICC